MGQTLRTTAGQTFQARIKRGEEICNAVTALIAPQLYDAGTQAISCLSNCDDLKKHHHLISSWPSIYSGMQVIVNRVTPPHRDSGGAPTHYDLLLSCGTHSAAKFSVPELDTSFAYLPGTLVGVSGKVFFHEVSEWTGGERICLAHFMKDAVHARLGVQRPTFPNQSSYFNPE